MTAPEYNHQVWEIYWQYSKGIITGTERTRRIKELNERLIPAEQLKLNLKGITW